ncbi:single-stranded DNA-binding protein, partial [Pseudomonas sp. MWU12-2312b]
KWEDDKGVECRAMKVQASRVGILPHRVESLSMMVPERPVPAPEADEPE